MARRCPICRDPIEHVRRERPDDPSAHPNAVPGPHATIEVDELCSTPDEDKWDRICTKAAVERSSGGGMMSPVLEVFYHYFDAEGEGEENGE